MDVLELDAIGHLIHSCRCNCPGPDEPMEESSEEVLRRPTLSKMSVGKVARAPVEVNAMQDDKTLLSGQQMLPGRRLVEPRLKKAAVAAFVALFLAFQIGVPFARLWHPRPARFAWHMFSANPRPVRFTLVMHDGTSRPVDLRLYLAHSRGEADVRHALPPHLCRVVPDLAAVRITTPDSVLMDVYTCP